MAIVWLAQTSILYQLRGSQDDWDVGPLLGFERWLTWHLSGAFDKTLVQ